MEDSSSILLQIYQVIADRRESPQEGSYTNYLLEKGLDKILKKVGEEAAETIIAAKNTDKQELVAEVSDLLYHLSVMLAVKELRWEDVFDELRRRELKQGNLKQKKHPEKVTEY